MIDYATVADMIDNNNLSSLFEARMFFEASTVALAAKRATKADIEKLYQFLDNIEENIRTDGVETKIGLGFHQMVADCCHNPVLSYIESSLLKLFEEYAKKIYAGHAVYKFDIEMHRAIVDAIAQHDSQKAYEMSVRDIRDYLSAVGASQELDDTVDLTRLPL
ncbi:Transcriptional regulator NanR [bioreactor metagenome]|uniref:Transcriptional regulator NanR n=1 Tax=bioreactor metagenome TaxID=1076179 RepID=A0A645JA44_9ZZZZ